MPSVCSRTALSSSPMYQICKHIEGIGRLLFPFSGAMSVRELWYKFVLTFERLSKLLPLSGPSRLVSSPPICGHFGLDSSIRDVCKGKRQPQRLTHKSLLMIHFSPFVTSRPSWTMHSLPWRCNNARPTSGLASTGGGGAAFLDGGSG